MPIDFAWTQALRDSPIFLVLVGCSVITLGVAFERLWYFWRRRADPDSLLRDLTDAVHSGSTRRASRLCSSNAHPFAAVAARLLESEESDEENAEEQIQIALSEQKLLYERNLGVVATMAAIAPLIGLLGTVWGIMRAFADMARIGSASPSVVAAGVAEALITTAAGRGIADPALILYNHLTRRMNTALTVTENHARALRAELRKGEPRGQKTRPAASDQSPVSKDEQRSRVHGPAPAVTS
jgi:biopolymer transport protein ExbB